MSHHDYPNYGRPFRLNPTGGDSHADPSYLEQGSLFNSVPSIYVWSPHRTHAVRSISPHHTLLGRPYQTTFVDPHQANDYRGDAFSHSIPHQPHIQDAIVRVPLAPTNGQPEGHREDIPPPVRGVAGPGRVQDPHHFDAAYQGTVDYIPQPLVGNPPYVFPDVGRLQGIPAHAQFNDPVNLERNPFDYVPQHVAQGPVYGAFPHPFVHRVPTPNQGGAEHLRRLAIRYLYHPDAQVGIVSMEVGAAGRYKVVIVLESHDIF